MTNSELAELLDRHERKPSWLARKLGISRQIVWRWANGRDPIPDARVPEIRAWLPETEAADALSTG